MADKARSKRKSFGRSASTESTEYSLTMGRSVRKKKPKERWLLSRKTWKYMADAGRKLIPDGARNCPEDIPKIEAHFQELCKKEPKFLLWRKNSYPGAIGFRKKRKHTSRKSGSCRKAISEGEVDLIRPERPKDLFLEPKATGKFDLKKMREEFLGTPTDETKLLTHHHQSPDNEANSEEKELVAMLEQYLKISNSPASVKPVPGDFNYEELVNKLQMHLNLLASTHHHHHHHHQQQQHHDQHHHDGSTNSSSNFHHQSSSSPYSSHQSLHPHVTFQGDTSHRSLTDTLSRYFGHYANRDKVISNLLTDRKALEMLYFDLRRAKNFRGSRGGTGYDLSPSRSYNLRSFGGGGGYNDRKGGGGHSPQHPPPLIEVESESVIEITYRDRGIQTFPIPENVLLECEIEFKKKQAEEEEEKRENERESARSRRRSSVDHDDVSQSVSDTIKRYLRMARKKSVDADSKAVGFKRVNYDRNLRNIKAKGEITKPGDDDGLNKGCQTNDEWILNYRDLKMTEFYDLSDNESRVSSARSSIDIGTIEGILKSSPNSPPSGKTGSHGFLSNLLHGGKHEHKEKAVTATAMQKSKSSSSVMQQGSLVAKKIFRSRSKSQTRPAQTPCSWINRGNCIWTSATGRQVILQDTDLLHLTEIERKVLQKVAIAKLQALNLGVTVKVPTDNVGVVPTKKRRPYLLKRKALTTSIFDTNRKDTDKESTGGLVFGIPLTQCVENDRLRNGTRNSSDLGNSPEERCNIARHGSRTSFSSLIDSPIRDETDSCESLMGRERILGSVPGLLDAISCSSAVDIPGSFSDDETGTIPNILSECFRHLENNGLHTFGIFRVSASKKRLRQLREDFDCGKETTIDDTQCPHDVANLLKEYLRDLPDPLLCRELYHAFIQTQRIRNRRLQFEAIQHLIQLLPPTNRDTLYSLLSFLGHVSKNSNDSKNALGEEILGNKMDSNNLATVFAPNILHCIKPGAKEIQDKSEDRLDVINVVRNLIDHYKQIFAVPAEILDEIYVQMVDLHPEALEQLLNKKDALGAADESVDELDSESNSAPWTPTHPTSDVSTEYAFEIKSQEPKRTYSREECLHESAATGGPNIGMRIRHKDKIRERSLRRKREKYEDGLLARIRGSQKDEDYSKTRSSSLESSSSTHTEDVVRALRMSEPEIPQRRKSSPYILNNNSGVVTASLTIQPVGKSYNIDDDIPYIEDVENGRQHMTIGVIKTTQRKRNTSVGSDSSVTSTIHPTITGSLSLGQGYDSAVGSSAATTYSSPLQNTPTSLTSSIADQGHFSSPPSWTSSPPTSPDSIHTSVNYIPDDATSVSTKSTQKERISLLRDAPMIQKVSFTQSPSPQTIQKVRDLKAMYGTGSEILMKSATVASFAEREPKFTPSITSIGNAVLKSRTADFERIINVDTKPMKVSQTNSATTTATLASSSSTQQQQQQQDKEKKKYTKRRYTDSRHPTRHIPDSESLETKIEPTVAAASTGPSGPVYKRREIISSVQNK